MEEATPRQPAQERHRQESQRVHAQPVQPQNIEQETSDEHPRQRLRHSSVRAPAEDEHQDETGSHGQELPPGQKCGLQQRGDDQQQHQKSVVSSARLFP